MAKSSTKKPSSIGRGHTLPPVNLTFEELDKLNLAQLRKYAKSVDVYRPKLNRQDLLRFICAVKKIRHPNDGTASPIPRRSPSLAPLSVVRRAAAPAVEATIARVPKYPTGRANRLDTRRFSPPPQNEADIKANYLDPEGFNCPTPESTPEPEEPELDERPVQEPPADAESLEQTVKMLQAFRKRNDELAQQIKEITGTAQDLKQKAADYMQSVVVQKASRMRMDVYLKYYKQEQPIFSHKVVFPPKDPVFVSVDKKNETITDEMDAADADYEEDFAIYRTARMVQRAQEGKVFDPNYYDDEDVSDDVVEPFDPRKAFYHSKTSRGLSESEKERFAQSRFISGDPDAGRRLYAALPDLKPKKLKRTASFRDSSDTETGESSTDALFNPGQPDDCSAPQRQNKRPRFDSPAPSVQDRFALHGERLWEGIGYTLDGPQRRSPSPVLTEPDTPPPSNEPLKSQSSSGIGAPSPTNGTPRHHDRADLFLDPNSVLPPRPIPTRSSGSIRGPVQETI